MSIRQLYGAHTCHMFVLTAILFSQYSYMQGMSIFYGIAKICPYICVLSKKTKGSTYLERCTCVCMQQFISCIKQSTSFNANIQHLPWNILQVFNPHQSCWYIYGYCALLPKVLPKILEKGYWEGENGSIRP